MQAIGQEGLLQRNTGTWYGGISIAWCLYCLWLKKLLPTPTSLLTVREMNELLRWKMELICTHFAGVQIDMFQNALFNWNAFSQTSKELCILPWDISGSLILAR